MNRYQEKFENKAKGKEQFDRVQKNMNYICKLQKDTDEEISNN